MLPLTPNTSHFEMSLEKATASMIILDMFIRLDTSHFEMPLLHVVIVFQVDVGQDHLVHVV